MMGYYRRNPEFVTLLNSENLHRGKHIGQARCAPANIRRMRSPSSTAC